MRETERRQKMGGEGREGRRRAGRELLLKLASDKRRKLQLFYQIVRLPSPEKDENFTFPRQTDSPWGLKGKTPATL